MKRTFTLCIRVVFIMLEDKTLEAYVLFMNENVDIVLALQPHTISKCSDSATRN